MQRIDSLEKTLMLGKIEGRGEGDDRGWDGWMASPTRWTWVWAGSGSWWWTGKPDVLQSMESQRVRHDWVTELKHSAISYCNNRTFYYWSHMVSRIIFLLAPSSMTKTLTTVAPFLLCWHNWAHQPSLLETKYFMAEKFTSKKQAMKHKLSLDYREKVILGQDQMLKL